MPGRYEIRLAGDEAYRCWIEARDGETGKPTFSGPVCDDGMEAIRTAIIAANEIVAALTAALPESRRRA